MSMDKKIKITWYATASVRITAGNSQLLIDPFFPFLDSSIKIKSNAYDGCSHILVSHGHFDHISSISEIVRDNTIVYCTKTPYRSLRRDGVKKNNLRMIEAGSSFSIGDFKITAYKGSHIKISAWDCIKAVCSKRVIHNRKGIIGKLAKIASFPEHKESLCFLVEVYGRRIMIIGSLAIAYDVDYPMDTDLALFPYQGSDELFKIAAGIYNRLKPKAVLLTHFDNTFPPFSAEIDTTDIEDYLKKQAVVYKLNHGESLEI